MKKASRFLQLFTWVAVCMPVVGLALEISTVSLPSGMEMEGYSGQLEAASGTPPYSWSFVSHIIAWGPLGFSQAEAPGGLGDVVDISAGEDHNLVLKADGTVAAWGANSFGQLDVPWGLNGVVAIAAGGLHNLALKTNGTLAAWGNNWYGQSDVPGGLSGVVAVAAGGYHNLALKTNGTIVAWGDNSYGQLNVPGSLSGVVAIAAGGDHSLALKADGRVAAWGNNWHGQTDVPGGLSGVVAIAAGSAHSLALKTNGTMVTWGANWSGQPDVPGGLSRVLAIAARGLHNLVLREGKTRMPEGLVLATNGTLSGTPVLAGTYEVIFVVEDGADDTAARELEIRIEPNSNTRPEIDSTDPAQGALAMGEATSRIFSVTAHDPEGQPLTYAWTWDGVPVGENAGVYTHATDWGHAGSYTLRCQVSDDLWQTCVYAQWWVTVLDDNDGDGMPNGMERDLGRDPNNPADGGAPSTLEGTVTGAGIPLEGAYVELRGTGVRVYHRTRTSSQGAFVVRDVEPGNYFMKVGAELYADEWHNNAHHRADAIPFHVPAESVLGGLVVDLASGQSPALVEVTSDPAGADIFLDYWPTGDVTPAVIPMGEIGDRDWAGYRLASHVITVKKAGHPRPSPHTVAAVEAETVPAHFDLALSATGAISVVTTPEGAEVYVDYAVATDGNTPITVGHCAPGSHTILLRKSGYLHPRPITAWVFENETTEVTIPLEPDTAVSQMVAEARSVPPGIPLYIDYLPAGQVTDSVVGLMDPASHAGSRWHSASHTILLRRAGAPPLAPRYVPEMDGTAHWMLIHLSVDPAGSSDCNGDGIPDWWWEQYGFDPCNAPPANAPADSSGMSYEDKFRAGLFPGEPTSRFDMGRVEMDGDPEAGLTITFVFDTVPGRRYVVQARESLAESGWTSISGVITATDYQTVFPTQIPTGAGNQFYRLIVLAP